jgi:hypothetical protein
MYAILAFSYKLNQTQRELNLEPGMKMITDERYAQQTADAFAGRLNRDSFLNTTDWVGKTEYIDPATAVITG